MYAVWNIRNVLKVPRVSRDWFSSLKTFDQTACAIFKNVSSVKSLEALLQYVPVVLFNRFERKGRLPFLISQSQTLKENQLRFRRNFFASTLASIELII